MKTTDKNRPDNTEFVAASQKARSNILSDFFSFLAHNKKWWMIPILICLLLFGLLLVLGGSSLAPFIYPLF
jgi:hypothetical protein